MTSRDGKEDLRRCLTALIGGSRSSASAVASGKMDSWTPRRQDSRGDAVENRSSRSAATPRGSSVRGGATPRTPATPRAPRHHVQCAGRTPWAGAPPTTGTQEAHRTVASPRANIPLTPGRPQPQGTPRAHGPTPPNSNQASRMSTPRQSQISGGSRGSHFGRANAESRMNLETQQYLRGIRLHASDNVGSLFLDPTLGKDSTILKSMASVDPLAHDSDTQIQDLQHRPRVPKLPFVTMDRPLHNASFLEDTSNAERRIDTAPKAKAGVANPGEAWAGWARDPEVVLDYSNANMTARRQQKFERQQEGLAGPAEERARLPGFIMKAREDGSLVKPLIGHPRPGEHPNMPHAIPVTETAWHATVNANSLRLNRTVGYDPSSPGKPMPPSTPRGLQKTDATDWGLDDAAYHRQEANKLPGAPPPSAGQVAASQQHVVERLKAYRALRDPPYFGKTLAPKAPRRPTVPISELMAKTKPRSPEAPRMDFRPRNIRETAAARAQIKVARKALRAAIDRMPIPEWSSGSLGASARSTNYLVPNLWSSFLKAGAEHGGRIQADDLKMLLSAVGVHDMSSRDMRVLFEALDTDNSGGIDWSEFSQMFISSASTE